MPSKQNKYMMQKQYLQFNIYNYKRRLNKNEPILYRLTYSYRPTKSGRAVKITGAKTLTFSNIIAHARDEKGLNMIGIIDCHSPEVIMENGRADAIRGVIELDDGGLAQED